MNFFTTYFFSGWDQLPFILLGIVMNVITAIMAANDYEVSHIWKRLSEKLIFYALALISIHLICFFPLDGIPAYKAVVEIALLNIDINVFKSLNLAATLMMTTSDFLNTDDNLYARFQRRMIPKLIGDVLRKYVYGQEIK